MDTSNPGPLVMLGGGILMVVGPILDWFRGTRGVDVDVFGLLGIFVILSGLMVLGLGVIRVARIETGLPDEILGFRLEQFVAVDAFASFLWCFALVFESGTRLGLHVSWLGAAAATTGALLALHAPTQAAPPPPGGAW